MGIYAKVSAEINCNNKKTTKTIKQVLKKMAQEDDNGNFNFSSVLVEGETVFLEHDSNRSVNLYWQLEKIWEKINEIEGVQNMNAPIMVEGEGFYAEN